MILAFWCNYLVMWYYNDKMELRFWEAAQPDAEFKSISDSLTEVRDKYKEEYEILYDTGDD